MDSSRRAVESYWRLRMIDGATTDEDKVTPVYKLEEICELLRSWHVSIVREVAEFILKRLDHKSPIVKQKALRLIKYAVGKSGAEFRREMQRNSAAVRQLSHYKGQPDPLKGDALNKAVRDTANEAIAAIFSAEDNKPAPSEDLNKRIQGFGNTNFEMQSEDKKSFLSEVVGIGSATLKQGFSSLTQAQSQSKNDTGSYRSPNLRRSLTTEIDFPDRYDQIEHGNESQSGLHFSRDANTGSWGQELRVNQTETANGNTGSSNNKNKTREEKLLETIVTSGGVRLQPTRDALQAFLVEALKLDALALSHALESKLVSPLWQVRMKAVCVLEAILRKKDEHFAVVASYFSENKDVVLRCSESPQASLRERSNKVLSLLDGGQTGSVMSCPEKPIQAETPAVQMPDLIDTGGPDDSNGREDILKTQNDQEIVNQKTSTAPIFDDLFGDSLGTGTSASEQKIDDDPFADVSFHANDDKDQITDIFSGLSVDEPAGEVHVAANGSGPEPFDIFGPTYEIPKQEQAHKKDVNDLVSGLSTNMNSSMMQPKETSPGAPSEAIFSEPTMNLNPQAYNGVLTGLVGSQAMGMNVNSQAMGMNANSQAMGMNVNSMFPLGPMAYNVPSGYMVNPAFSSQPVNYGAMGSLFAQQQLLATVSNFQQMANLQSQDASVNHAAVTKGGAHSSPFPDIFNPAIPTQIPTSIMNTPRKEETKAFDFISDHLAAARDPKRVV